VLAIFGIAVLAGVALLGYGALALHQNWFPFHSAPAREVTLGEARRRFAEGGTTPGGAMDPSPQQFVPAAGVYQYEGTGSESLSTPPRSQSEGPRVPGTVTRGDAGCWSLRLDYSTNHWRRWDYCVDAEGLVHTGGQVYQRWDFGSFAVENVTTMSCRPPSTVLRAGMAIGEEWESRCRGSNTQVGGTTISTGTHRLVRVDRLEVGGAQVQAYHFRDERRISGAQSGTERFDMWLDGSGLLLSVVQRIEVDSDSPLGEVTYTQESAFALVSTVPVG